MVFVSGTILKRGSHIIEGGGELIGAVSFLFEQIGLKGFKGCRVGAIW